ncbi:hypothetical protein BO71DRAFT_200711 [Aspergillus ellipticus CBS 707.79]|uniref:Uncharacterized protein n=1 Tax=Aspergillus ellipticus CBS 707.79 TaxID=1448320 RepID=A0A319E4M3_9EURO|nr:hypothetical protein BO71DRAFT_200711 [Aspergillus ellipticus CBS 707.79]
MIKISCGENWLVASIVPTMVQISATACVVAPGNRSRQGPHINFSLRFGDQCNINRGLGLLLRYPLYLVVCLGWGGRGRPAAEYVLVLVYPSN